MLKNINFDLPTELILSRGVHSEIGKNLINTGRTLVVTDENLAEIGLADKIKKPLVESGITVEIFSDIYENPDAELVKELSDYISSQNFEQIVALGGGSPIDAAKAAACLAKSDKDLEAHQWEGEQFFDSVPLLALPTTAGTGSEVTGVAVITSRKVKKGIVDQHIFPEKAIIDPELMQGLPSYLTAITGMDALTHAVEAYLGLGANIITDAFAEKAIELISQYLKRAFGNGDDIKARQKMAEASAMAGIAMDQSGLGIVHSLAGPMCSHLHLSHGLANAILLPYGMEYNLLVRENKIAQIGSIMGINQSGNIRSRAEKTIAYIKKLQADLELDKKMKEVLDAEVDCEQLGKEATKMVMLPNNPRKAGADDCTKIYRDVFELTVN